MIKEKIINLIPSKTMRDFLHENPHRISIYMYDSILADMPISLKTKKELLSELYDEWDSLPDEKWIPDYKEKIKQNIDFLSDVLNELNNFDRSKGSLILNGYQNKYNSEYPEDYDDCNPRECHFTDPVISYKNTIDIISGNIYDEWEEIEKESGGIIIRPDKYESENEESVYDSDYYYELELYKIEEDRYVHYYTYTLNYNGEVLYVDVINNSKRSEFDKLMFWEGGHCAYFPTPYKPGDILYVKCKPFFTPQYCLVSYIDDPDNHDNCCGVRSFYKKLDGYMKGGAFKHGHYCDSHFCERYLTLIFCAEIYKEELPEEYGYLHELSEIIKAKPELGEKIFLEFEDGNCTLEQVIENLKNYNTTER